MKSLRRFLSSALCAALLWGCLGTARAVESPAEPPVELPVEEETLGVLSGNWNEADPFLCQSDLANLIHEAQLWATGAQVSILPAAAVGTLETEKELADMGGPLHPSDCQRLYTREEVLYTVELTGLQLKDWLETVADHYVLHEDGTLSAEGNGIDQIYGISYEMFLGNPSQMRVGNITYQGKRVNANEIYRVAVSSSRLAAASQEDSWGWFAATGVSLDSAKVLWDASQSEDFGAEGGAVTAILAAYFRSLTAEGKEIIPPEARSRWRLYNTTSDVALRPVTRLQFVEALYEAVGAPAVEGDASAFTDLPEPSPAALWAAETGLVVGNGAGQFLPESPVSREQALVMLLRYDISRDAGPQGAWAVALPYTDAVMGSPWAAEALMWNVVRGYLLPDDGGNLSPQANLTAVQLEDAILCLSVQPDNA